MGRSDTIECAAKPRDKDQRVLLLSLDLCEPRLFIRIEKRMGDTGMVPDLTVRSSHKIPDAFTVSETTL